MIVVAESTPVNHALRVSMKAVSRSGCVAVSLQQTLTQGSPAKHSETFLWHSLHATHCGKEGGVVAAVCLSQITVAAVKLSQQLQQGFPDLALQTRQLLLKSPKLGTGLCQSFLCPSPLLLLPDASAYHK